MLQQQCLYVVIITTDEAIICVGEDANEKFILSLYDPVTHNVSSRRLNIEPRRWRR